jgi:hypothetical protein
MQFVTLKLAPGRGYVSINPGRVCFVVDSPAEIMDEKIDGAPAPYVQVGFDGGFSFRVLGTRDTVKILLEVSR